MEVIRSIGNMVCCLAGNGLTFLTKWLVLLATFVCVDVWSWCVFVTLREKEILFVRKFPAVNLYSRTLPTRVGLFQFPLDLTKKILVVTQRVPFDYQLLSTGRKTVLLCSG